MRRVPALVVGLVLSAAVASPALAAPPLRVVIDLGTPDVEAADSAFFTDLCGFAIEVSADASVTVHVFFDRSGTPRQEIDGYQIRETLTNTATGTSVTFHDVGPDRIWTAANGTIFLASIGRSFFGSQNVGRVVINLDTGQLVSVAGRSTGDVEALVCEALAA